MTKNEARENSHAAISKPGNGAASNSDHQACNTSAGRRGGGHSFTDPAALELEHKMLTCIDWCLNEQVLRSRRYMMLHRWLLARTSGTARS